MADVPIFTAEHLFGPKSSLLTNDIAAPSDPAGHRAYMSALCDEGTSQVTAVLLGQVNAATDRDGNALLHYLPLGPLNAGTPISEFTTLITTGSPADVTTDDTQASSTVQPSTAQSPAPAERKPSVLPILPVELWNSDILPRLSRSDAKSMRLVCREFEKKVSGALFHTSLVTFNTGLYDMSMPDNTTGRGLRWENEKQGDLYNGHGLRVFQGFGPHIKRFGMAFEVTEDQLANPPPKKTHHHVPAYHGAYEWPVAPYARFSPLAHLEETADQTPKMKQAFSHLQSVKELALSVDSGLGWLNGNDQSIYAQVFQRPCEVFGHSKKWLADPQEQQAAAFWAAVEKSHLASNNNHKISEVCFAQRPVALSFPALPISPAATFRCDQVEAWPVVQMKRTAPTVIEGENVVISDRGVVYTTHRMNWALDFVSCGLRPRDLTVDQTEWLMETRWAQAAFLESYVIAVTDNRATFANVTTLNIAKISSSLLSQLAKTPFWEALPALTHVTLLVKPDWRTVDKSDAGVVESRPVDPSAAVNLFYNFLGLVLREISSITSLKIGWASGGEHAEGIRARNANLLPAPVTALEKSMLRTSQDVLPFPSVKRLTLTNCWIAPPTLKELVASWSEDSLEELILDSVSLTASPFEHPSAITQIPGSTFAPPPPTTGSQSGPFRFESWPDILPIISPHPGISTDEPPSEDDPADDRTVNTGLPRPLQSLEFRSCGYAFFRIMPWPLDQHALEFGPARTFSEWFERREQAILKDGMTRTDHCMGKIIQHMPEREITALRSVWGLRTGWQDAHAARGPVFDGKLPGGTGRFSGIISNSNS